MSCSCRHASHAGSWYLADPGRLGAQLEEWLRAASTSGEGENGQRLARGVIAPHAGYSYSGSTAAFAYKHLKPDQVDRIFILGPSHHVYIRGCALSGASEYETPLGNLIIDRETTEELHRTGSFEVMDISVDEDEHSIEMHLPYIAKVMGNKSFKVVPILVGSLTPRLEEDYGRVLAPYLENPRNFFVVSSDFCHWGSRFQYTPYDASKGSISQFIRELDHECMEIIERQDLPSLVTYFKTQRNTVCGRHPIGVMLNAMSAVGGYQVKFLHYRQSSECKTMRDSSVSYASALIFQ